MTTLDDTLERRGLMLVLTAPSGAGKSTLTRRLLNEVQDVALSVSVTTRDPRPGEEEGIHYYFIDKPEFERMAKAGELLEYANVFGQANGYGTPAKPVLEKLSKGIDVLFDIDWQGCEQLTEKAPGDVVRVYVLPPSIPELHQRLVTRGQDAPETIARRMRTARSELAHWEKFDYVIVNDDLDATYERLKAILLAERLKRARRTGLTPLLETMLTDLSQLGFDDDA